MNKAIELKKKYQRAKDELFVTLSKNNDGVYFNNNHMDDTGPFGLRSS
jgi:hypothetical protein